MPYVSWEGYRLYCGSKDKEPIEKDFMAGDHLIEIRPPHPDFTNNLNIKENDTIKHAEIVGDNIDIVMESGDRFQLLDFQYPKKTRMVRSAKEYKLVCNNCGNTTIARNGYYISNDVTPIEIINNKIVCLKCKNIVQL